MTVKDYFYTTLKFYTKFFDLLPSSNMKSEKINGEHTVATVKWWNCMIW